MNVKISRYHASREYLCLKYLLISISPKWRLKRKCHQYRRKVVLAAIWRHEYVIVRLLRRRNIYTILTKNGVARSDLWHFTMKQCESIGINYHHAPGMKKDFWLSPASGARRWCGLIAGMMSRDIEACSSAHYRKQHEYLSRWPARLNTPQSVYADIEEKCFPASLFTGILRPRAD